MSIEGQYHFFTIYFPGFVCFVLYLDKISGERLQGHWSSGLSIGPSIHYSLKFIKNMISCTQNVSVIQRERCAKSCPLTR